MTVPGPPLVGVLALQGDVREHERALRDAGAQVRQVRVAADLDGLDGLVVPGGESTAMGRLLDVSGLLGALRAALADGLPAYGSCAGMVLLADEVVDGLPGQPLLGGLDVTVRRNAFGGQVHSFEALLEVDGLPPGDGGAPGDGEAAPLHAVFIRAPWVERTGPAVEVLAEVDGRPVAVRSGRLLATAFHPELTGDGRVHALFLELVRTSMAGRSDGPVPAARTTGGAP